MSAKTRSWRKMAPPRQLRPATWKNVLTRRSCFDPMNIVDRKREKLNRRLIGSESPNRTNSNNLQSISWMRIINLNECYMSSCMTSSICSIIYRWIKAQKNLNPANICYWGWEMCHSSHRISTYFCVRGILKEIEEREEELSLWHTSNLALDTHRLKVYH
jgi:hypothetical protein